MERKKPRLQVSDVMQFSGTKKELQVEREHAIFQIMLPTGKVDLPLLREPLDNTKLLRKHNGKRWKNVMKKIQIVQVHVRFHINGRKGRHKNKQWSWTLCIWNEWLKIPQNRYATT